MSKVRVIKRTKILSEDGEVLEEHDVFIRRVEAEMFVKFYVNGFDKWLGIRDGDWKVFCCMIRYLEKDSSQFILSPIRRQEVSKLTGKKVGTINMCLSRLVQCGLLNRVTYCVFNINDTIVYNGREDKKGTKGTL